MTTHDANTDNEECHQRQWKLCNRWKPTSVDDENETRQSDDSSYVVVPTTDLFRKFSSRIPPDNAFVVEIGCANGFATEKILQRVPPGRFLGIDISPKFVRECQVKFPEAHFEMINVLMEWKRTQQLIETKLRKYNPEATITNSLLCIFVDIGGNREVESLLALLQIIQHRLQPHCLIVKSKELFAFGQKHGLDTQTAWNELQSVAQAALKQRRHKPKKYHPLKLPQRYNSNGVAICRFHNYDPNRGCLLFSDLNNHGKECPFDHEHCHSCLEVGHVAWQCPTQQEPLLDTLLTKE